MRELDGRQPGDVRKGAEVVYGVLIGMGGMKGEESCRDGCRWGEMRWRLLGGGVGEAGSCVEGVEDGDGGGL